MEQAKKHSGRALYMVLHFFEEDGDLHVEKINGEFTKAKGGVAIQKRNPGQSEEKASLYMTESESSGWIVRSSGSGFTICRYWAVGT
jgi:hypothetical protein